MKRINLLLTTTALVSLFLTYMPLQKANALSGSDFNAGRIIDDVVFTNKDSMTVQQIQQFLDSKVPVCDRNRASSNPSYQPPYTCLKEYQENTTTGESNYGRFNPDGSPYQVPGAKSAAQIIWDAAQQYNINPQSLIVLLQKEQSLITDDWPWLIQYQKATGYLCPDTAPCDPALAGFYRQVDGAAWQFRNDMDGIDTPGFWSPFGKGWNNIPYNPNAACGTKAVNIENQATAVLYKYTPYTPNAAALNNLYGTGDGCSAYGNRNFWRMFNDWFGSTLAPNYSWQMIDQYAYSDETKTVGKGTTGLLPGDKVYVGFKAKNTGNTTWSNSGSNPVNVGMTRPLDRSSQFYDSTWLGPNRPATLIESTVAPGEIGTFEFWMVAPSTPGSYQEFFSLVAEHTAWFNDPGMNFYMQVAQPVYSWQFLGQYAYTDQTKTVGKGTSGLLPGDRVYVGFKARNTGNITWKNSGRYPVNVGMTHPVDRLSPFFDGSWLGQNRPATLIESTVAPGEIGTFEFWMKAPGPGNYVEHFSLVSEHAAWFSDPGMNFYMQVAQPVYSWQMINQYAYTDETKTTGKGTTSLNPGERVYVGFRARNTGNVTWKNSGTNPVNVGMTHPVDRLSPFFDGSWLGQNRPATLIESAVAPGEIGTFEFWMKAPPPSGTYLEYFSLVSEYAAWFNDPGMNFYSSVR